MIWVSLILMKYMNNLKTFAFTNRQRYTVFIEYRHTETFALSQVIVLYLKDNIFLGVEIKH